MIEKVNMDRATIEEMEIQERPISTPDEEAIADARSAGLCYVNDRLPGYTRRKRGSGFSYYTPDSELVTDPTLRERFNKLVIPPAWREVWICVDPNGHIQATGRDEKGRKQYIYHPLWEEMRSQTKFERMLAFSQALPHIREQVDHDLRLRNLSQQKVVAAVVRLLESTLIRIGNPEYARKNKSFGLITLHNRHFHQQGETLSFQFKGKSGQEQNIRIRDPRLARLMRRISELPGQHLFQYIDEKGQQRVLDSGDINTYLREAAGEDLSAKDFRTWGGTVHAAMELYQVGPAASERESKRQMVQAVKRVASYLGNTPAVARSYYIHPRIFKSYQDQSLFEVMRQTAQAAKETRNGLTLSEIAVARLLEKDEH